MKILDEYYFEKNKKILIALGILFFIFLLIRVAWISDDSAITLRTVLNFINGYGPVFNIYERVQAYTHPLWFFIISFFSYFTKNVFITNFALSITFSVLTYFLFIKYFVKNIVAFVFVTILFFLSKSFMDYSTSGLENPLVHFLLLVIFILTLKLITLPQHNNDNISRLKLEYFLVLLTSAGLVLTRMDMAVLVFPLVVYLTYFVRFKLSLNTFDLVKIIALASIPLIAWFAFSLLYYGFLFPNTAYAKLGTGIPFFERIVQGIVYFLHGIYRDPLTVFVIAIAIGFAIFGSVFSRLLGIGIVLYSVYIVNIGGDFMEGRFFSGIYLAATLILVLEIKSNLFKLLTIGGFSLVLGLLNLNPNIISGGSYNNRVTYSNGIADERGVYMQRYSLLKPQRFFIGRLKWHDQKEIDVKRICGGLGFSSIINGPSTYFIDTCALADPLLARIPAKYNKNWRIGHFVRLVPDNYEESILTNQASLSDIELNNFYKDIRLITRGDIFDIDRLKLILKINFGSYQVPDMTNYRFPEK